MSNILMFRASERVEIWSGRTKESPDRLIYFLDYVEPDGRRGCVWDGDDIAAARGAADEWRRDGIPVVDLTASTPAERGMRR